MLSTESAETTALIQEHRAASAPLASLNRGITLSTQVIHSSFFQHRLPPPEIFQHEITQTEITEMFYSMMLAHSALASIVSNKANAVLFNYEKFCFALLLKIHLQSAARLAFKLSPVKEEIPLLTDIEIAATISEGKKPVICIEGGGTYFRFSVVSPYNRLKNLEYEGDRASTTIKTQGGNCNAIGWELFIELLDNACRAIRIDDRDLISFMQEEQPLIVAGMAGMGGEINRQKLVTHFIERTQAQKKHVLVTSDADTYLAALPGFGAVLIAGTGSICLGITPQGKRIQSGGLGAQFSGDPGSAFSVGKKALLACLQLRDGGVVWIGETKQQFIQEDDPLFISIEQRTKELFNITFDQAVGYFNREHDQRPRLAQLAPLVFGHAFERHPSSLLAKKIIVETAAELARQLGETMEGIFIEADSERKNTFPVILIGGLFDSPHHTQLVELIEKELHVIHPDIKINWQHEPTENYVSRVVQNVLAPAPIYRFARKNPKKKQKSDHNVNNHNDFWNNIPKGNEDDKNSSREKNNDNSNSIKYPYISMH